MKAEKEAMEAKLVINHDHVISIDDSYCIDAQRDVGTGKGCEFWVTQVIKES